MVGLNLGFQTLFEEVFEAQKPTQKTFSFANWKTRVIWHHFKVSMSNFGGFRLISRLMKFLRIFHPTSSPQRLSFSTEKKIYTPQN